MAADVSAAELDYVQIDRKLVERAIEALDRAMKAGVKVVTAESCTGGLIATVLSEAPGAAELIAAYAAESLVCQILFRLIRRESSHRSSGRSKKECVEPWRFSAITSWGLIILHFPTARLPWRSA